jgi:hypothetical protein
MYRATLLNYFSFMLLTLTMLTLASCSSDFDFPTDEEPESGKAIEFTITPYETEKFKSAASDAFSQLSLALLPTSGSNSPVTITQNDSDKNLGTISATIPFGEYELVIVGHNGDGEALVAKADSVVFPANKITDTFCHYQVLNVTKESASDLAIELKRCVAKMEIVNTDAIPAWAAKIETRAKGGGMSLNPKTGLATCPAVQEKASDIPQSYIGKTEKRFSTYSFLTDEETDMEFNITFFDSEGNAKIVHSFTEVPMRVNQITRYTGELFSTSAEVKSGITADTAWGETKEYTF